MINFSFNYVTERDLNDVSQLNIHSVRSRSERFISSNRILDLFVKIIPTPFQWTNSQLNLSNSMLLPINTNPTRISISAPPGIYF